MIKILKTKILTSRKVLALFLLLLVISAAVRCYRLKPLTVFLDDQGRDVLVAAQILKEGKIPFIGPMASIGSLYLGPLFYWSITPFLWLANFDPIGPIFLVAFFGWLANIVLFFLLAKYFNNRSAFVGSFLYALSPLVINNSRFIWNPNPVPLFTLMFCWFFLAFWEKEQPRSLFWAGIALGVLIQLHYVTGALFLVAFLGFLVWLVKNRKVGLFNLLKPAGFLLLGIALPLLPFILFEIKNHFINTRAGWRFIFGSDSSFGPSLLPVLQALSDLLDRFSREALVVSWAGVYFLVSLLAFLGVVFSRKGKAKSHRLVLLALVIFFLTLLLALAVIKGQIHLHYLGLLLPVVFIIIGGADYFWQRVKIFGLVNISAVLVILFFTARADYRLLIKEGDNQQINRAQGVAIYIAENSEDKNIFVTSLSGSPYAYNYRYYLYLLGFKTDSLKPSSVFAICEGGNCGDPEGHALWEIAQFGILKTVLAEHVGWGIWIYELKPASDS